MRCTPLTFLLVVVAPSSSFLTHFSLRSILYLFLSPSRTLVHPPLLFYFILFYLRLPPLPLLPLTEPFHPPFYSVAHVRLSLTYTRTHSPRLRAARIHVHRGERARTHQPFENWCHEARRVQKIHRYTYIDVGCTLTRAYLCAPVSLSRHAHHWANIRLTKQGRPSLSLYTYPCTVCGGYIVVTPRYDTTLVTRREASIATKPNVRSQTCVELVPAPMIIEEHIPGNKPPTRFFFPLFPLLLLPPPPFLPRSPFIRLFAARFLLHR